MKSRSSLRPLLFLALANAVFGATPPAVSPNDIGYRLGSIEAKIDNLTKQVDGLSKAITDTNTRIDTRIEGVIERVGRVEQREGQIETQLRFITAIGGLIGTLLLTSTFGYWWDKYKKVIEPPREPMLADRLPSDPELDIRESIARRLARRRAIYEQAEAMLGRERAEREAAEDAERGPGTPQR